MESRITVHIQLFEGCEFVMENEHWAILRITGVSEHQGKPKDLLEYAMRIAETARHEAERDLRRIESVMGAVLLWESE